jgi:hypothetical protein
MGTVSLEFAIQSNGVLLSREYQFRRTRRPATGLETGFEWFGKSSEESLYLGLSPHGSALQIDDRQDLYVLDKIDCRLASLAGVLQLHARAFFSDRFRQFFLVCNQPLRYLRIRRSQNFRCKNGRVDRAGLVDGHGRYRDSGGHLHA